MVGRGPSPRRGGWHQTFVDNVIAGSFRLAGGLRGEEMVMSGSQPVFNFATIPQVVGNPYEYGVPGARHAVLHGGAPVALPARTREEETVR